MRGNSIAIGWGDTNDSPNFGYAIALPYSVNPFGSIKDAYINAIGNVSDGGGCPQATGGTSYPGGINGCGCHAIMAMAASASCAVAELNENWSNLTNDGACATGTGIYTWAMGCNYNPSNSWSGGP